ncbi:MAG: hypothetical protein RSA66_03070, partial [Muribaculaceae bacterium]
MANILGHIFGFMVILGLLVFVIVYIKSVNDLFFPKKPQNGPDSQTTITINFINTKDTEKDKDT